MFHIQDRTRNSDGNRLRNQFLRFRNRDLKEGKASRVSLEDLRERQKKTDQLNFETAIRKATLLLLHEWLMESCQLFKLISLTHRLLGLNRPIPNFP